MCVWLRCEACVCGRVVTDGDGVDRSEGESGSSDLDFSIRRWMNWCASCCEGVAVASSIERESEVVECGVLTGREGKEVVVVGVKIACACANGRVKDMWAASGGGSICDRERRWWPDAEANTADRVPRGVVLEEEEEERDKEEEVEEDKDKAGGDANGFVRDEPVLVFVVVIGDVNACLWAVEEYNGDCWKDGDEANDRADVKPDVSDDNEGEHEDDCANGKGA